LAVNPAPRTNSRLYSRRYSIAGARETGGGVQGGSSMPSAVPPEPIMHVTLTIDEWFRPDSVATALIVTVPNEMGIGVVKLWVNVTGPGRGPGPRVARSLRGLAVPPQPIAGSPAPTDSPTWCDSLKHAHRFSRHHPRRYRRDDDRHSVCRTLSALRQSNTAPSCRQRSRSTAARSLASPRPPKTGSGGWWLPANSWLA
jgi:hypothetical protein